MDRLEDMIATILTITLVVSVILGALFGVFKIATVTCGCVPEKLEARRVEAHKIEKQEELTKFREVQMRAKREAEAIQRGAK